MFRAHWREYCARASVTPFQHKVAAAIMCCRTEALGGHLFECSHCGHQAPLYNSCRNRHCPKCQADKAREWVEARSDELLPVPYFHVVFTLPHELNELLLMNRRLMYELFFKAVSRTLLKVGERNLKCRLGFFSLLHSWGQTLTLHPHLHVVVPGVGLSVDGTHAVRLKKRRFLLPDKILSAVFRGKFISALKRAHKEHKLRGAFDDFEAFLDRAVRFSWVVRTKPPFGGPEVVLKYLARYTHRVAIGNSRIITATGEEVKFRYKDYRLKEPDKQISLAPTEFIRRFLLHVLPPGFVRVRYYGFLARGRKTRALALLREALGVNAPQKPALNPHRPLCPHCNRPSLVEIGLILRVVPVLHQTAPPLS